MATPGQTRIITVGKVTHLAATQVLPIASLTTEEHLTRTACGRKARGVGGYAVKGEYARHVTCGNCRKTEASTVAEQAYSHYLSQEDTMSDTRTFADLQPGHVVGEEIVLNVWTNPVSGRITIHTTGRGYAHITALPTDPAPAAVGASPLAQKTWEIREFRATLSALEAERQEMLPDLPADLLADLDTDEQAECPEYGCDGLLNAYAETDTVSPVLGWGPVTDVKYADGKATYTEVQGLWLSDYEYGDATDPIHEIRCTAGHEFRVPAHFDRNV